MGKGIDHPQIHSPRSSTAFFHYNQSYFVLCFRFHQLLFSLISDFFFLSDSLLYHIFSQPVIPLKCVEEGVYEMELKLRHFDVILKFLRNRTLDLPTQPERRREILSEFALLDIPLRFVEEEETNVH